MMVIWHAQEIIYVVFFVLGETISSRNLFIYLFYFSFSGVVCLVGRIYREWMGGFHILF